MNEYKLFNNDLKDLSESELNWHYLAYGHSENRIINIETFNAAYPEFDLNYYKLHPYFNDLNDLELMVHYNNYRNLEEEKDRILNKGVFDLLYPEYNWFLNFYRQDDILKNFCNFQLKKYHIVNKLPYEEIIKNKIKPNDLYDLIDNLRTDKATNHSYLQVYEKLFNSKKNCAKNILEIGIQYGGSIKLWKDYFINAHIYALDIMDINNICNELKSDPNIFLFTSIDAYDKEIINNIFLDKDIKFDIMIDDGPHTLDSMIYFIKLYLPLLDEIGIFIIEDISDIRWIEILTDYVPEEYKKYIEIYDLRNSKDRFDDILFVINKNKSII
jgi:hypothetical protein